MPMHALGSAISFGMLTLLFANDVQVAAGHLRRLVRRLASRIASAIRTHTSRPKKEECADYDRRYDGCSDPPHGTFVPFARFPPEALNRSSTAQPRCYIRDRKFLLVPSGLSMLN
jgi:hypothetical protein